MVKVTDGDTVHVLDQSRERHKIRLGGIDVPESNQAFGTQSKQNLAKRIAGQNVEVEFTKEDQYGRSIGKILLNGTDINLTQVVEGYAWHYKKYQREQSRLDQALYSMAETQARSRRIGLWRDARPVPPWDVCGSRPRPRSHPESVTFAPSAAISLPLWLPHPRAPASHTWAPRMPSARIRKIKKCSGWVRVRTGFERGSIGEESLVLLGALAENGHNAAINFEQIRRAGSR